MHESWAYRLSPCPSESSSTRSSHLSVYTAASSVSSPPPSPTTGSKTKAFFGSPFADHAATPLPPPNPQPRPISRTSSSSDAPSDVSGPLSDASTKDTPRIPHTTPSRTLNADFFGVALLPTPPPSIRSLSHSSAGSRDTSTSPPPHRNALPPLSRFFPSRARYGSESDHPPPPSHGTNVRRERVHLDTGVPSGGTEAYHAGERTESPVDDQLVQAPPALLPHPPSMRLTPTATARPPTPPPSEPEQAKLQPGVTLSSSSLELELVKPLGTGSFSSVWLARDTNGQLNALELVRKSSLARSKSLRGRRSRTIDGTRPTRKHDWAKARAASDGDALPAPKSPLLSPQDQIPREKKIVGRHKGNGGRLVAVKMTERELCDSSSRSCVSFVREVEVLRHISHPSIVSYLHSFSTPTHHCLVLEHVGGGELLDLVDNPDSHARLDEPLVRRIWGELCRAVAWMHSVGLVHRDIKLENILLTVNPFARPLPSHSLIKLTDFGLSRFIDPAQPHLTTLCGSDSYAAPELVMGKVYDGRQTDAWACGVVLYTLATRRLPFDTASPLPGASRLETDREDHRRKRAERKALLNRIAVGTYSWPDVTATDAIDGPPRVEGVALARSEGLRRMVGRLLVRDPRKRARVADLWVDEWMRGEGAPPPPVLQADEVFNPALGGAVLEEVAPMPIVVNDEDGAEVEPDLDLDADPDEDEEGVLVDEEDIGPGHVVHQEH
ncbi:transporter [Ganoderma sinense ZZ0214-1]|uniref:Transporter n=1 Tax=Ganoderma sinense ZZ0214-1 TaxID=1077348 RepID=A0A2G8SA93_9APHY|nr:transporter [Ganoderma sinense ZZ0214-1]